MKSLLVREQVDGSTVLSTNTKYIQGHSTKLRGEGAETQKLKKNKISNTPLINWIQVIKNILGT